MSIQTHPTKRAVHRMLVRMRENFAEDVATLEACNDDTALELLHSSLVLSYAMMANLKGVEPGRRLK